MEATLSEPEKPHPHRVPGAERAVADLAKFDKFLLNASHEENKGRAKFFSALGIGQEDATGLRNLFLKQLPYVPATFSYEGEYTGLPHYKAVIGVKSTSGDMYNVDTYWEVHPQRGTKFLTATPGDADDISDDSRNEDPGVSSS